MQMDTIPQWQSVTANVADQVFNDDALIAEFATDSDEASYEKHDSFLIVLIKRACKDVLGPIADVHTYHIEDWWPNHTRYISVSADHCTRQLIMALHSLLTGEFLSYRIQVIVDADLSVDGSPEIGALTIYADRIIVEDRLNETLGLLNCGP